MKIMLNQYIFRKAMCNSNIYNITSKAFKRTIVMFYFGAGLFNYSSSYVTLSFKFFCLFSSPFHLSSMFGTTPLHQFPSIAGEAFANNIDSIFWRSEAETFPSSFRWGWKKGSLPIPLPHPPNILMSMEFETIYPSMPQGIPPKPTPIQPSLLKYPPPSYVCCFISPMAYYCPESYILTTPWIL